MAKVKVKLLGPAYLDGVRHRKGDIIEVEESKVAKVMERLTPEAKVQTAAQAAVEAAKAKPEITTQDLASRKTPVKAL